MLPRGHPGAGGSRDHRRGLVHEDGASGIGQIRCREAVLLGTCGHRGCPPRNMLLRHAGTARLQTSRQVPAITEVDHDAVGTSNLNRDLFVSTGICWSILLLCTLIIALRIC
jgi:hypothetical protein